MKSVVRPVIMASLVSCSLVFLNGCFDVEMYISGYHKATREEILMPTAASFPPPKIMTPIPALSRDKIVGKWETTYTKDTRFADLGRGYDRSPSTSVFRKSYSFLADGTLKDVTICGKEVSATGKWNYHDGMLTISSTWLDGKNFEMTMKVLWYAEDQFEIRLDTKKYEQMLSKPDVTATCRYETNGVLHTQILLDSDKFGPRIETAFISVESPRIFKRATNAE